MTSDFIGALLRPLATRAALPRLAGAVLLLLLAAQAVRALTGDVWRYRVGTVLETTAPAVIPPGYFVLTYLTPVARMRVGDVIAYAHPLRERAPVFVRVGHIDAIPGSAGYLVRLDLGDPNSEPWFAELYGSVRKVELWSPPPGRVAAQIGEALRAPAAPAWGAVALAVIGAALTGWYRWRPTVVR